MHESELISVYALLFNKTEAMANAARAAQWETFVQLEADSVLLLSKIETSFKLDTLSHSAKASIAKTVSSILVLHQEINGLAQQWRQSQIKQFQSDAMAAKVADAYS